MKVDAVVQARMGSTRLPGKVLMRLGDDTVLAQVVKRLQRSRRLRHVLVATTTRADDDALVTEAARLGVPVVRGPVEDVLARYAAAARQLDGDAVLRITSDCPLIDAGVIDDMLARHAELVAAGTPCDYLSNTLERRLPRGLDAELVRSTALLQADAEARAPHEREHVTPYLYQHPERFALHGWRAPVDASAQRWTLDTPQDLELLQTIYAALGDRALDTPWLEVLALVQTHPHWAEINREVRQKDLRA
jgi:spore coat polysaccharide biosynthesis protein SpsF